MNKIAIITDTASDICKEDIAKYGIKMLHYQILYKDKTYKDQLEIHSKDVLDRLEQEVPTTSLPAIEEIHQVFQEVIDEGYDEAIVITLSSGLSGCYNAVCMVANDYSDLKIHVYDSRSISMAQGVLVIKAAQMAAEGKDSATILKAIEEMRNNQQTLFIVDTLKYLQIGGRIGRVSAVVGTLLNLKPIITIGDDGKYETVSKVRGRVKAIAAFAEKVKQATENGGSYEVHFTHADGQEIVQNIKSAIFEQTTIKYITSESWISPVACVHCGPGYVGMLIQKI